MKIGTKVRTLYQYSARGIIVKPRSKHLPLPNADWFIVKLDKPVPFGYGRKGYIAMHRNMLEIVP